MTLHDTPDTHSFDGAKRWMYEHSKGEEWVIYQVGRGEDVELLEQGAERALNHVGIFQS